MVGISLILVSLVPVLQVLGLSEQFAYTICGLLIAGLLMLPGASGKTRSAPFP